MPKLLSMLISLFLITAVCGGVLGFLRDVTSGQVKINQQVTQIAAAEEIFPGAEISKEGRPFGRWMGYGLKLDQGAPTITKVPVDTAPLAGWRAWVTRLRGKTLLPGDQVIAVGSKQTSGMDVGAVKNGLAVEQVLRVRAGGQELELTAPAGSGRELFPVRRDGKAVGVAFLSSSPGFGGDVGVMVGIDLAKNVLAGIRVTQHSETPGVGAKAQTDPSFPARFQKLPLDAAIQVKQDGGQIDAITGATITSRAVCTAVAEAASFYAENSEAIQQLLGEPGGGGSGQEGGER